MAEKVTRAKRGGRPASGSIFWRGSRWWARITLPDGSRPAVELDPAIPHADRDGARACATQVTDLARETGVVSSKTRETVREWVQRWLAWRLERGLASVDDDRGRLDTHVLPTLGARDVRSITRDDLEALVDALDRRVRAGELGWKTATHAWSLVRLMFADAAGAKRRALRVREDDPARGVHPPDRGVSKAKVYLYPTELAALLACDAVPVAWRRMFAITTYLFARAGEVNALTWDDVDLEREIAHIHGSVNRRTGEAKTTKTGTSRRVPIVAPLLPLLRAMHAEAEGLGRVSPISATDKKLSRQLQRCLRVAGITRADLFASDASRKPMTFHDLRATGITWCAVAGVEALKIKQRAGHASFSTTEGYIREAENLAAANFGEPFPALPACILRPAGTQDATPEDAGVSSRVSSPGRNPVTKPLENKGQWWRRRESKKRGAHGSPCLLGDSRSSQGRRPSRRDETSRTCGGRWTSLWTSFGPGTCRPQQPAREADRGARTPGGGAGARGGRGGAERRRGGPPPTRGRARGRGAGGRRGSWGRAA